jgi:ribosomal protein L9
MARPKNVENMTHEERIVHFEKFREREAEKRQALLDTLPEDMMKALESLQYIAKDVGEDLQIYGPQVVSVAAMHRLIDDAEVVRNLFNIGRDHDE